MKAIRISLASSVLLMAATALAQPVTGKFSYQGRVELNGQPVDGPANLTFTLWNAAAGGSQVGGADINNGVTVTDGLFTVELNDANQFGSTAFDGNQRWVEITVNGTTLTPRQQLNATPYAAFALNAPGSGLWSKAGNAISNTNTNGFVGINRSTQVTAAEYFGIQAPATGNNFGGMYIRTDSDTARPFYGYVAGPESSWTYLDGATGSWHVYNGGTRLTVEDTGDIGIGTTNPAAKLHVDNGSDTGNAIYATQSGTSGQVAQFYVPSGSGAYGMYAVTYGSGRAASFESHQSGNTLAAVSIFKNGGPGLQVTGLNGGTGDTDAKLNVLAGTDAELASGGFVVCGSVASSNLSIDNNEIMARNNGAASTLWLNNDGGNVIIAPNGTTTVRVLEITGADVAEKFPVSEEIEAGMVVMIDSDNPGKLCLSKGAYNKRVAGIASGANGLSAGTILGNLPGSENSPAIALSGRVWVHCDAGDRAIDVGDMLTTSDKAGYAMAVEDPSRAHGAVIGKAMTGLAKGETGMVLVLVNLQ